MTRYFNDYLGNHPALYARDVIRRLGIKEPPVDENEVAEFLGYEIRNVSLEDMAEFPDMPDIFRVAPAHLLREVNLILINDDMRRMRKRTCAFHEFGHEITPWHDDLNYACSENGIEPVFLQRFEREAFICGAEIQMPHHLFICDTLDLPLSIDAIKNLATRYDATLETTAIRYAQMNRRICAIVVIEPWENCEPTTTILDQDPTDQPTFPSPFTFPLRKLSSLLLAKDEDPPPLRVKYCVRAPRFPSYIRPGTGITEGNPIFDAWNTEIPLREELPASVFGCLTKEVYNAEIFPLGKTGMVMALLSLPDHQLVLDSAWESLP